MKIGIVSFAHPHAYSYLNKLINNQRVDWLGFFDDDQARAKEVAAKYQINSYASIKELMEQKLDGVIVASENAKHREQVCLLAPYRLSILCEKPLATNCADGLAMIKACQEHGSTLGICYPVRYLSSIREMKNKIKEGVIGRIEHITASNHGSYPGGWFAQPDLSGGGALIDHTVHVCDIVYWMTGARPTKVIAMANTMRAGLKVEDLALLNVEWNQGFDLTLDSSWSRNEHYPIWGDVKFKIYGNLGMIEVDSMNQVIEIYSNKKDKPLWSYWGDDMDQGLIDSFVDSIEKGVPFPVPAEDGLVSLKVVDMAYHFLRSEDNRAIEY
ncbi:MAG: Gfo/Idh/MocA family oxidoreductase [Halanaerobiales bacterium]|nr:Gfo/Idh/MocA family oxidoreductase [Halanaerobiales bacterium]